MNFYDKVEYTLEDIYSLIENEVEENIHLDYKGAGALEKCDKNVFEDSGVMPNPTYDKLQEGCQLAKDKNVDFIQTDWPMMLIDYLKRTGKYYKEREKVK